MKTTPETEVPKHKQFHFWRIVAVCWAVVAFCAGSAWIISTYFY